MHELVLTGGLVVGADGVSRADVGIDDGVISAIGDGLGGRRTLAVDGAWVGPGFVDLHVHLREPGQEWKEDIASGSAAAAAGGFTAVVAQPNTDPATDSAHIARHVLARGAEVGLTTVAVAGAITMGRAGTQLAHLDDLWDLGVRMFSDDGDTVADAGLLRRAMEYLADRGGLIAQHAEDRGLAAGGHIHEGVVSARLGVRGLPSVAEEVVVARDLRLVELTGCRYHVQHVSAAGTLRLIADAKAAGLPVTAEVAPHHLAFDHHLVERIDAAAKMYPPLRTDDDRRALIEGLRDGTIDAVATDHAPHTENEKDVPLEEAPRGVIGLETSASAIHTDVGLDPTTFYTRMAAAPARIAGLADQGAWPTVGAPANLAVFHPDRLWNVTRADLRSKSANSPWLGSRLRGRVLATVHHGSVTFDGTQDMITEEGP